MGTRRRNEKRSRSGCLTCKKRHVKCDETRPKCLNCVKRNHDCQYGVVLLWEDDALKKGISFGRSVRQRTIRKQSLSATNEIRELTLSQLIAKQNQNLWVSFDTNRFFFLNWHNDDFEEAVDETDSSWSPDAAMLEFLEFDPTEDFGLPMVLQSPALVPEDYFMKAEHEQLVLDFMVRKVFPKCTCYGVNFVSFNPYLNFIIPLAMHSSVLFKSVIAASAISYSSSTGDKSFLKVSQVYTKEVLRALPALIESKLQTNSSHWDEILATILVLCFSDITSKCDEQWLQHLSKGKNLLRHQHILTSSNRLFLQFFIRYITSHDIMWETVRKPLSTLVFESGDDDLYERFKNDSDKEIDVILGCSPYLLTLINKISELGDSYETLENEDDHNRERLEALILRNSESLHDELELLQQVTMVNPHSDGGDLADAERVAEIKRLTALIYLYARITRLHYRFHTKESAVLSQFNEKTQVTMRTAKTIINLINRVNESSMTVLWPLFIIGLVSCDQDDRWFILNRFTEMEKHRGLASITRARETVESAWKNQDLECDKVFSWKELTRYCKTDTLSLA